ncbi:MAG: YkgJ family cysteine cluster protein [Planctomycetes bacterium]|nr:YkgJ family cysteine cluster protein [Planctomycetota bacterium]
MTREAYEPWYKDGLQFGCTGCGECCRGLGGYVWISLSEAEALATALGMEFDTFTRTMLRKTITGLALVDDADGNCPLLGPDGRCKVYNARPVQCRTWPWWNENLVSSERWREAAKRCPGMNRGEVHSQFVIDCERAKEF